MRPTVLVLAAMLLLGTACASAVPAAAPAPTKTAAPAATSAASTVVPAASTKAVTAAPATSATAAPASGADFPAKGKVITFVNPWEAGGSSGIGARLLADPLERVLGVQVTVSDKPGAGSQIGMTELANMRPDGYSLGYSTLPTIITLYLNPDRKTLFQRNSFVSVAGNNIDRGLIAVRADSPYKSIEDLVAAAKANPEKIKAVDTGILGAPHLGILQLQHLTGAKLAVVHVDSGSANANNLLGGHVDVSFGFASYLQQHVRSGALRALGVMASERDKFLPDVKTMEEQGYKGFGFFGYRFVVAPAGTPPQVVDTLDKAVRKVAEQSDFVQKMEAAGLEVQYMDAAKVTAEWANYEERIKPLMEQALSEQK